MDRHAARLDRSDVVSERERLRHGATRVLIGAAGVAAFALATLLASQVRVAIPISRVPVTLQTFVVLLAGLALGPRLGAASQIGFVALALAPWGGFAGDITFTAGYVVGFVVAAWLVGHLAVGQSSYARLLAVALGGSALILLCGSVWLASAAGLGPKGSLLEGVVPYIPGDAAKAAAAAAVAYGLRRRQAGQAATLSKEDD